jgi:hypothetical protein
VFRYIYISEKYYESKRVFFFETPKIVTADEKKMGPYLAFGDMCRVRVQGRQIRGRRRDPAAAAIAPAGVGSSTPAFAKWWSMSRFITADSQPGG